MRTIEDSSHVTALNQFLGTRIDRTVFYGSAALILPFILLGAVVPDRLASLSDAALSWMTAHWGWLYLVSVNVFVIVAFAIALSPLGRIRLGRDDERPEYSRLSWFAMLFSAGMGIGLVFWSIAEPLYHFSAPPAGIGSSPESARLAFSIFFHHWGIHAWGTYVAVGLPMAYFQFRKGFGATVAGCLTPLLRSRKGEYNTGRELSPSADCISNLVDILAVWATVMGVVTSLGLGALQITSGLSITFGIHDDFGTTAMVIIAITLLFVLSAISGVKRGIRYLSLTNIVIMTSLLLFFFIFGPFGYQLKTFGLAMADYIGNLLPLSTTLSLFDNRSWTENWTIFYWAWWIAWAPFVGAFIANISRGRTVREFTLVVIILPALFSFIFASTLGGTAIHLQLFDKVPLVKTVSESIEGALFTTLHQLPYSTLTAIVANLLIASFFITSADSATFIITKFSEGRTSTASQKGNRPLIIFWGCVLGGLALVLISSGGLKALQTASIVGALPFVVVMYFLLYSLTRELIAEFKFARAAGGNDTAKNNTTPLQE